MVNKYRHVYFDLDRTLWDFETNSRETLHEIFERYGLNGVSGWNADRFIGVYKKINHGLWLEYRRGEIQKPDLRFGRFYRTLLQMNIDDERLARSLGDEYVKACPHKTCLLPHARNILEYLNEKYELHIISNGFEEAQYVKLDRSGLRSYFKNVVLSEQVGVNKPSPKVFEYALRLSGGKREEGLMIGDDLEADIIGARNFGMDQVFYNPSNYEHEEELTYEIGCLSELREFI